MSNALGLSGSGQVAMIVSSFDRRAANDESKQ